MAHFGLQKALTTFLILGLVGIATWYIIRQTVDVSPQWTGISKTYTDTARVYSVQYPYDWTIKEDEHGGEGAPPDYSTTSRTVRLVPPGVTEHGLEVTIQAGRGRVSNLRSLIRDGWKDSGHIPQATRINGYEAEYVQEEFKNAPYEEWTDHNYLIIASDVTLYITFREKWYHPMSNTNWDGRTFFPEFNFILNSVTLLD